MKRRLAKTILYRISATLFGQVAFWLLLHRIEVNVIFLLVDCLRMGWYYFYDWLWERKDYRKFCCPLCGKRLTQDCDDPRFWCRNETCNISWLQIVDYDDMPMELPLNAQT